MVILSASLSSCADDNLKQPTELEPFNTTKYLERMWYAPIGAGSGEQYVFLRPLKLDDKLVTASRDGVISVIKINSGDMLEQLELDTTLSAGVGGDKEVWLVASRDAHIIAIDARTLTERWRTRVPTEVLARPQLHQGKAIVRTVICRTGLRSVQATPRTVCESCPPESTVGPQGLPVAERVLDPRNRFLMYSMMQDVIQRGTATRARALGRKDLAGKTGTTNDLRDSWFAGFTGDRLAVIWLGRDDNQPMGLTGAGGAFADNAARLGVELSAVDLWRIGQTHYRHGLYDLASPIFEQLDGPLFVHWLGAMFHPGLEGYFPAEPLRMARAASSPGAQVSPPPGWVPIPERKSPCRGVA